MAEVTNYGSFQLWKAVTHLEDASYFHVQKFEATVYAEFWDWFCHMNTLPSTN